MQCSIQPKSKIDSMFFCLLKTRGHMHSIPCIPDDGYGTLEFSLSTETSQTTLSTQNTELFTHVRVYNGNLPDCESCSVYVDMSNRKQLNNRIDSY